MHQLRPALQALQLICCPAPTGGESVAVSFSGTTYSAAALTASRDATFLWRALNLLFNVLAFLVSCHFIFETFWLLLALGPVFPSLVYLNLRFSSYDSAPNFGLKYLSVKIPDINMSLLGASPLFVEPDAELIP